jgi:hypothetical protein
MSKPSSGQLVIAWFVVVALCYAATSFVCGTIDFVAWGLLARLVFIVVSFSFAVSALARYSKELDAWLASEREKEARDGN